MRRVTAIAVLVFAIAASSLDAHIIIPAEFREVVTDATVIVRGRVTDVRSVSVPGAGIDSIATVAVEAVIKGQAIGFIYVRVPGGLLGRTRFVMVGAPTFRAGQRAILFLKPGVTDTAFLRPIGLTLGVYPVQVEPATRRWIVQPPIVGGRTTSATGPSVRGDSRRQPMTVAEFEALVRVVMAQPAGSAVPRGGR